jgi:hypothetical protein
VSGLTETTATLVGSVNTANLLGSAFFSWRIVDEAWSTSAPVSVPAVRVPTTISASLEGLTTGSSYEFTVTVSTSSGTVVSPPLEFVPQKPVTPVESVIPSPTDTASNVSIPHFEWPFTTNAKGVTVAQQDTDQEVDTCVMAIAVCQIGAWVENPAFGIPDPTFKQVPLDLDGVTTALTHWEPRATESAVARLIPGMTDADWQIDVTTEG